MLRRLLFQNTARAACVASASAAGFQRHQHHHHQATVETSSQGVVTAPHLIGTRRQCATKNNNNNITPPQVEPNQQRSVVTQSQSSAVTRFARLKTTLEKLLKYEIHRLPENDNNKLLWNEVATFQESIATAAVESYFRMPKSDHERIPPRHDTQISHALLMNWLWKHFVEWPRPKIDGFATRLINLVDECYRELSPKVTLEQISWKRRRLFGYFDTFISQTLAEEISNRHDQNSSFDIYPCNSRSFDEITNTWRIYSVILLCGSSGSGKTGMALNIAHSTYYGTIVFYLKASDLARGVADSGANRDEIVMDNLLNACECTMDNGELVPPSFDNIEKMNAPDTHVIIVVDDCGTEPEVLQGLFATSRRLSITLHNQIFTDAVSDRGGNPRVRFVACTTGATYATYGTGSKPDYLSAFYLDEPLVPAVRENVYDSLLNRYRGFHNKELCNADELTFLERLSQFKTGGKLSIAEERMKDIVKNARAAASFLEFCKQAPRNDSGVRTWATSLPAFRQFVSASIPMVTHSYFRSNTLWKHVDPMNWLALATAFAFHRFPFAPATLKPSEIMRALPKSKKEMDDSLAAITHTIGERNFLKPGQTNEIHNFLCTKGGVLVDIAEKTLFVPRERLEITNFIPKCDTSRWSYDDPERNNGCRSFCPHTAPGRFHLPPAQAAMAFSSVGLPSDSRWSRTEHLAADVCTVLAGSSRAIHSLFDAVNAEMQHFCGKTMKDYHAAEQAPFCRPSKDPFFPLKELLLFDRSVESAEYHRLHASPLSQADAVLIQTKQNCWQSFKDKYSGVEKRAIEVNQLLEKALSENKAVVLQTPDMDSFVDIVVVGPGRVILIRSKSNVEKGNIDYFGELLNMRVLDDESFVKTQNNRRFQERIDHMFREMFLAAILHAADRSSAKGEFETWLEAKPRTWSKSEDAFNNGLNLEGTCTWTSKVDLHVCFFVEAVEHYDLSTVGERFRATVELDEKKIPVSVGEIKWQDDRGKPDEIVRRLKFRRDLGLKSVELVAFERDCSECPRALAPFTISSASKSEIQPDFKGAWKISEKF